MEKQKEKKTNSVHNYWELLTSLEHMIFNLRKDNITQTVNSLFNLYKEKYSFSFNMIVSQMIYIVYSLRTNDFDVYVKFIEEIETTETNLKSKTKISDVLTYFFINKKNEASNYILNKMIEQHLIDPKIFYNEENYYFIHYMSNENINKKFNEKRLSFFWSEIKRKYKKLSENDWELHKKLIKEGVNPDEISKIIRNDEIEKLQEISSQTNFDINQTIEPSLYERCSFINYYGISLIDYAAFFSSIKCFKYLLMNGANVEKTGEFAIAGGNEEIIHLCEQNHSTFKDAYETAIEFHRNDIFKYIFENKIDTIELEENRKSGIDTLKKLGEKCIQYHNYEIFSFLLKEGMEIYDYIINVSAKIGNLYLVKYFRKENQLPKDILIYSSKSGNIELVNYLLKLKDDSFNVKDI